MPKKKTGKHGSLSKSEKKTKFARETLQAFGKLISRQNTPEKLWVDKGTEHGEFFKNLQMKDNEVHSTMSETKAAFAEIAFKSLKHIIYRYIEDHCEKICSQIAALCFYINCPKNQSIEKSSKDVINSDFFISLYKNRS